MSTPILHRCPFCGHVTDISDSLAVFIDNPHCNQCGLSASEGDLKLQDDLVVLFNKQMSMETPPVLERPGIQSPVHAPITYSITQHYHHSSHVAHHVATPKPVTGNSLNQTAETLRQHKINPNSLSLQQLELFENAIPEQRSRLIQIWQICPEHSESAMAKAISEDFEMGDPGNATSDDSHNYAEPYMISGYELTARELKDTSLANEPTTGPSYKQSNDPVYHAHSQRWWERTQHCPMEY